MSRRGPDQDNPSVQSAWPLAARLMPVPATATEKAALAASSGDLRSGGKRAKTRMALGTAAVVTAVAVPTLSLGAVVGSFGGPYFGDPELVPSKVDTTVPMQAEQTPDARLWSPADEPAGPLYAEAISAKERTGNFDRTTRLSNFNRDVQVELVGADPIIGSREFDLQEFDLAFAGVEVPTPFVAPAAKKRVDVAGPLFSYRSEAIRTPSIAIDQITDMDLVVKATPEDAGEEGTALGSPSSSARTDAISNRSVEAAFAGAIDASSAVRDALPIATTNTPTTAQATPRAIAVGAPPRELRGAAAAQATLVPKTQMDARVNGVLTGNVDFEQRDGTIAIRLRSVANVMREQFSKTELGEILGGSSIDRFITLEELKAAGIPINYNPAYDEVEFGIDYQDAPNAKKVQVDQISVAPQGAELTAIEQIPR